MAVQPQTPYKEYTANGSTKSFSLEFDCDNQDHLIVLVDDVEAIVGTWSLSNGAVVFGNAPATGKKITVQRNTPFRRDGDFQSYDNSFRPGPVNKGFDWIWLKLQELGVADWILSNRIDALKSYVNQQDGILQDNIDSLKNYVDDKDDELRNYLLNAIQEQGVALDQLEEYYSYLMQQLAQVAIDRGWAASFIVSADGSTQQEINDFGGAKWWPKPLGYDVGATVKLASGDVVRSTEPNNTNNPNVDMTGWVKINSASQIFDASGEDQQLLNTGLTTVSQLPQISSPYDGMRMRVKSVVEPNYALARPFIGGGEFFYSTAKAQVNDGGVIINGWVRVFDGAVKPEWWGADPTGANSSLSAMQSAIDYCRNNPTRPMSAARGGMGAIELDGVYIWDGQLDLTQVNGLTIKAKSRYTTTVVHTPNSGYMFYLQRYLNINFDDIAFYAGTYNFGGDKLVTIPLVKGATAFNFSGVDGGRRPTFNRCEFQGFKTVFRTMDDLINCDTLAANQCDFSYCDTVWENNNPNAVIWAFNDCGFYAYKEAFINPANSMVVIGGQAIGETLWKGLSDSQALNSYLLFKSVRFESYLNLVPTAKPKWLDIDCHTTGTVFEGCPMYGIPVGGMDNVETGKIRFRSYGDIKFKNCQVRGYFSVISAYAGNGSTARLTFEDCEETPLVNQTYEVNANNRYINLIYKDKWTSKTTRVNRTFLTMFNAGGSGGGPSIANSTDPMIDVFSYLSARTSALVEGRALPLWCIYPYKLNISKFEFSYAKGVTAEGFNVAIYRDSTKAVKIAEMLNVGVGRLHGAFEIAAKDFLVSQEINSSSFSSPIYLEVSNVNSLGLLNLDTHVHLIQQAHAN